MNLDGDPRVWMVTIYLFLVSALPISASSLENKPWKTTKTKRKP